MVPSYHRAVHSCCTHNNKITASARAATISSVAHKIHTFPPLCSFRLFHTSSCWVAQWARPYKTVGCLICLSTTSFTEEHLGSRYVELICDSVVCDHVHRHLPQSHVALEPASLFRVVRQRCAKRFRFLQMLSALAVCLVIRVLLVHCFKLVTTCLDSRCCLLP